MAINYDSDIIYEIDVDLHGITNMPTVYAKQYDENARYIVATVWNDGNVYTIPEGTTAIFACTKPDGKGVANPCTIENNKIIYEITLQTTIVHGSFGAEFRLFRTVMEDSITIQKAYSTPKFKMFIDKTALLDSTLMSTDEVNVLTGLINNSNVVLNNMTVALNNATESTNNSIVATQNAINATNDSILATESAISATTNANLAMNGAVEATETANIAADRANTYATEFEQILDQNFGINDNVISIITAWSSNKINNLYSNLYDRMGLIPIDGGTFFEEYIDWEANGGTF
jgi:hypothetical protein